MGGSSDVARAGSWRGARGHGPCRGGPSTSSSNGTGRVPRGTPGDDTVAPDDPVPRGTPGDDTVAPDDPVPRGTPGDDSGTRRPCPRGGTTPVPHCPPGDDTVAPDDLFHVNTRATWSRQPSRRRQKHRSSSPRGPRAAWRCRRIAVRAARTRPHERSPPTGSLPRRHRRQVWVPGRCCQRNLTMAGRSSTHPPRTDGAPPGRVLVATDGQAVRRCGCTRPASCRTSARRRRGSDAWRASAAAPDGYRCRPRLPGAPGPERASSGRSSLAVSAGRDHPRAPRSSTLLNTPGVAASCRATAAAARSPPPELGRGHSRGSPASSSRPVG